ncbi:hypothetical protein, partial [Enterococcus faecium]
MTTTVANEMNLNKVLTALSKPISPDIFKNILPTVSLESGEYHFYKLTRVSIAEEQSSRQSLENIFSVISGL